MKITGYYTFTYGRMRKRCYIISYLSSINELHMLNCWKPMQSSIATWQRYTVYCSDDLASVNEHPMRNFVLGAHLGYLFISNYQLFRWCSVAKDQSRLMTSRTKPCPFAWCVSCQKDVRKPQKVKDTTVTSVFNFFESYIKSQWLKVTGTFFNSIPWRHSQRCPLVTESTLLILLLLLARGGETEGASERKWPTNHLYIGQRNK